MAQMRQGGGQIDRTLLDAAGVQSRRDLENAKRAGDRIAYRLGLRRFTGGEVSNEPASGAP